VFNTIKILSNEIKFSASRRRRNTSPMSRCRRTRCPRPTNTWLQHPASRVTCTMPWTPARQKRPCRITSHGRLPSIRHLPRASLFQQWRRWTKS